MKKFTVGSVFSGVGGLCGGFQDEGFEIAWQVELDDAARGVLDHLYPAVPKFKDIRDVGKHNLSPVDVLVGGFPCTNLSVAGKRDGLKGEQSGLFFEMIRVIDELKPTWVVIENVPGMLSQIEEEEPDGVCVCGWNPRWRGLLDSGDQQAPPRVRQSRLHRHDGMREVDPSGIQQAVRRDNPSGSQGNGEVGGSVGMVGHGESRDTAPARCPPAPHSETGAGETPHRTGGDEDDTPRPEEVDLDGVSTPPSGCNTSDRDGSQPKGTGTRTARGSVAGIGLCEGCGRSLTQEADAGPHRRQAVATVLWTLAQRGYYGAWRLLDAQLFGVPQRRLRLFGVFARGYPRSRRAAEVLALSQSVLGNPAKGRKARTDVAAPLTRGTPGSGPGCGEDAASGHLGVGTLQGGSGNRGYRIGAEDAANNHLVAFGRNNTSGPDGTAGALMGQCGGRGDFETETFVIQCHGSNVGPIGTLRKGSGNHTSGVPIFVSALTSSTGGADDNDAQAGHLIAFGCKDSDPCGKGDASASPTLRSRGEVANATEFIVRRLMPIETERLMNWPDGTTEFKVKNGKVVAQADAPRYRQCGNGVVKACARYVARRLKKVMESMT